MPGEQRVAPAPGHIVHRAGRAAARIARIGGAGRLVADAAHQREFGLGGQHLGHVAAVEPGLADAGGRQPRTCSQLAQPAGLAEWVPGIVLDLDMDQPGQIDASRIRAVVLRQVAVADLRLVAVTERDRFRIAEPGIVVGVQVPEMGVGVDDRQGVLGHRLESPLSSRQGPHPCAHPGSRPRLGAAPSRTRGPWAPDWLCPGRRCRRRCRGRRWRPGTVARRAP